MANLENKKAITELTKKIANLERWALQYKNDKSRYDTFVSRIGSLKSSIDIIERTTNDNKLILKDFKKDVQEHSGKAKKYFEELVSVLPFNWEQLKEECTTVEIDAKKHQSILGHIVKIKTEITAFYAAHNFYSNSEIAKKYYREQAFLAEIKKDVQSLDIKIKDIETYVLPSLAPVKAETAIIKNSDKKIHQNDTKLEINLGDFQYSVKITGTVQWDEEPPQKIIIDKIDESQVFQVPWNVKKGRLQLDATLTLKLNKKLQKTFVKTEQIYVSFSVNTKGEFEFSPLKNKPSVSTISTDDLLIDALEQLLEETIKGTKELKHPTKIVNKWLKTQLKGQGISTQIISTIQNRSVVIKINIETSDQNIDLSAAPFDVGISSSFTLKGDKIESTVGSVDFKIKQPTLKTVSQPTTIQFDKEGEFKLDKNDENELQNWWRSVEETLKDKLTAYEQSKNTPKDEIKELVDAKVDKILLSDTYSIRITGFASSTESENKNNKIAANRAENIKKYLVKKLGINENRIRLISDGEKSCISKNGNDSNNAECRVGIIKFSINYTP